MAKIDDFDIDMSEDEREDEHAKVTELAVPTEATETKADKFKRLASARVTKALNSIDLIGNLSGSGYEYTPEQIEAIFTALNEEMKLTYLKFQPKTRENTKKNFSL